MVFKVKKHFGYDDSLDAFGVHGMGGTMGALFTGLLASAAINPVFGKDAAGNSACYRGEWTETGTRCTTRQWPWALAGRSRLLELLHSVVAGRQDNGSPSLYRRRTCRTRPLATWRRRLRIQL